MPTDSGFTVADNIAGSEDGIAPWVARDRNGDVWVAWQRFNSQPSLWTHTYTTATTSTPRILSNRRLRGISWTLSEPAPESWWAVLVSRDGGAYEQATRVRAGSSQNMSWIDTSPISGSLRYKVRRECLDARYVWESQPGRWPPGATAPWTVLPIELGIRLLAGSTTTLELTGVGEAPVEVELFDLQGRHVFSQRLTSSISGSDSIRFELDVPAQRLGAGVYFARAHDESGRVSAPAKLVILR